MIESVFVTGVAFFFGWVFGNSKYGRHGADTLRLPTEEEMRGLVTTELEKQNELFHSMRSSFTRSSFTRKSFTSDRGSEDSNDPKVLAIENAIPENPLSFERYKQAELISPTKVQDMRKLAAAEELRKKAATHGLASRLYLEDSRKSRTNINERAGNLLVEKSEKEINQMIQCNVAAATIYFKHNNPTYRVGTSCEEVDLHGLTEKEALRYTETIMQNELKIASGNPIPVKQYMTFIIGMGNHKEGGIRKTQLSVEKFLNDKYGFFCIVDKPDKFCLWVEFEINDTNARLITTDALVL